MSKDDFVKEELRVMRSKAFQVKLIVLRVLKKKFGLDTQLRFKEQDQLQLYRLWVWSVRYKVPLPYIIENLVGWWRGVIRRGQQKGRVQPKRKVGLGVRVGSLVSKKSEGLLQSMIERDFPEEENIHSWRQQRREELVGLDEPRGKAKPLVNVLSPDEFLYNYSRRVKRRMKRLDRATASGRRRLRRWRDNPWL